MGTVRVLGIPQARVKTVYLVRYLNKILTEYGAFASKEALSSFLDELGVEEGTKDWYEPVEVDFHE